MNSEIIPNEQEEIYGERIWNYMKLNHTLENADLILGLGSLDLLPARMAAQIYSEGYANKILFTGGSNGRNYELLPKSRGAKTEAEMLAKEALEYGVLEGAILLENKAKNSGENIKFSKKILEEIGLDAKKIIVSHMPSAERRDYATLRKQWQGPEFIMASPSIRFRDYHIEGYQGLMSRRELINDMLGDFQRLFVFSKKEFGYMMSQQELGLDLPSEKVKEAYAELTERGYGAHQLVPSKETGKPYGIF